MSEHYTAVRSDGELKEHAETVLAEAYPGTISFESFMAAMEYAPEELDLPRNWHELADERFDHPYAQRSPAAVREESRYWHAARKRTTELVRIMAHQGLVHRGDELRYARGE